MSLATFAICYAFGLFCLFAFGCLAGQGATVPNMVPAVAPRTPPVSAPTMPRPARPALPWSAGSTRAAMVLAVRAHHEDKARKLEAALRRSAERKAQIKTMMRQLPLALPRDAKGRFVKRSPLLTKGGVK